MSFVERSIIHVSYVPILEGPLWQGLRTKTPLESRYTGECGKLKDKLAFCNKRTCMSLLVM